MPIGNARSDINAVIDIIDAIRGMSRRKKVDRASQDILEMAKGAGGLRGMVQEPTASQLPEQIVPPIGIQPQMGGLDVQGQIPGLTIPARTEMGSREVPLPESGDFQTKIAQLASAMGGESLMDLLTTQTAQPELTYQQKSDIDLAEAKGLATFKAGFPSGLTTEEFKEREKIKAGFRGKEGQPPAVVKEAQWLIDNGIASDTKEAYDIAKSRKKKSKSAFLMEARLKWESLGFGEEEMKMKAKKLETFYDVMNFDWSKVTLPKDVSQEDVEFTAQEENMTIKEVLKAIKVK